MTLTRRNFIAASTATAILPFTIGCAGSQSTIAAVLTTIGTGLMLICTSAGNSALGAIFQAAANKAASLAASWVPGTPGQDVVEAVNDLISVLTANLIPGIPAEVAADIDNALSTLTSLLGDFGITPAALSAAITTHAKLAQSLPNKYPTLATIKAAGKNFTDTHNRIIAGNPAYAKAKL